MAEQPPTHKYQYFLIIRGNSHEEIAEELLSQVNGGYLMDSDYGRRDEFEIVGGRTHSALKLVNPEMTPDRYAGELSAWMSGRKAARDASDA